MTDINKRGLVWGFYTSEDLHRMREWLLAYLKDSGGIVRTVAREIGVTDQTLSAFILEGIQYPRLTTAIKLEKFITSRGGKIRSPMGD